MADATADSISRRDRARFNKALAASLLVHAILLTLQFELAGMGMPGLDLPWQERHGQAGQLHAILAPSPSEIPASTGQAATSPPPPPPLPAEGITVHSLAAAPPAAATSPPPPAHAKPAKPSAPATKTVARKRVAVAARKPAAPKLLVRKEPVLDSFPVPEPPKETLPEPAAIAEAPGEPDRTAQAEEEQVRIAEAEALAAQAREEAMHRKAEEEAKRLATEAEARRLTAEAETRRLAAEAEVRRLAEEAEAHRLAQEAEARRLAAEAEARRLAAETEARRLAAEAEAQRLAAEAEGRRLAAEAEGRRLAAEAEARRLAQEAEARRLAAEAEARRAAEERSRQQTLAAVPPPPVTTPPAPRRKTLLGRAERENMQLVIFAELWRQHISMKAPFDLLEKAKTQPYENPWVTVSLRSDGSVDDVTFDRSSGVAEIDFAVRRIILMMAPYNRFPRELAAEYDVIDIPGIWTFNRALRVIWGGG